MRIICLHEGAADRLTELGADLTDLTPSGLDGTSYRLFIATQDQARALEHLKIEHEDVTPKMIEDLPPRESSGFLYSRGGKIPNGTRLRIARKSRSAEGEVRGGRIWVDGKKYGSPSEAASAVGYISVNGWQAWEYYDEQDEEWYSLSRLRTKLRQKSGK